jgi:fatty-acyl-CoA synthase
MYVGDIAGRRALYSPDALAVVDAGYSPHRHFTYRDLDDRANRLACWLRDTAGVGKGDRVGMLAYNGVEYLDAFFACGKLGAILVPYNWRLHWHELLALMEITSPRVLIFSAEFATSVEQIVQAGGRVPHLLALGGQVAHSVPFEAALETPAPVRTESVEAEDIACLIFTGGTSGAPKGAMISHRMIAWNTQNTVIHNVHHGDITVNVFPMFHTGGLLVYTMPLMIMGGTVVLPRTFDAAQTLALIEQYRATIFAGVPTVFQMLADAPNWNSADLSSVRILLSGGAPMPVSLIERYRDEKGLRLAQGFGMTEFGPGIFNLPPEDAIRKAGSIGRPNFFVDAAIMDDDGHLLPPDSVGELVLKGPSMCSGYFNDPTPITDARGWFHTGDLARCDSESYFTIVDRKKDMFISGGENVYPNEVEQVLYKHPAVQACAVVGVPDVQWGEVGMACVVVRPGASLTEAALIEHARGYLARYKVPRYVRFMEALPMSAAGKILRRELRDQFATRIGGERR